MEAREVLDVFIRITAIVVLIGSSCLSSAVVMTFNKYHTDIASSGMSGGDVAQQLFADNGIDDVQLMVIPGTLTDHYDLKRRVLRLSESVAYSRSISAIAVAAHECGHVIQHHEGYRLLSFRNAMAPVAKFVICAGAIIFVFGCASPSGLLCPLGAILVGAAVLFYIVTFPVEFNASKVAITILEDGRLIRYDERERINKVLRAATMTYIAAVLASIVERFSRISFGDTD